MVGFNFIFTYVITSKQKFRDRLFLGTFKTESIRGIILSGGDVPSEDDLRSSLEEELILHSIKSNVTLLACRGMNYARYFELSQASDGHVANQHSLLSIKLV